VKAAVCPFGPEREDRSEKRSAQVRARIHRLCQLSGKTAVRSGAGGHLGSALARRLWRESVRLNLMDSDEFALRELALEFGSNGHRVVTGETAR